MAQGAFGMCQANGYCSFPDAECPSGQRYGELAGGGFAGLCVEDEAGTTGAPSVSTSTDGASSGPGDASTLGADSATTAGTHTSSGPAASSSDGDDTNTSSDGDTSSESTTTGPSLNCSISSDDFEDGTIDQNWMVVLSDFIVEQDGALQITLSGSGTDGYPQLRRFPVPWDMNEGYIRVEVTVPPPIASAQMYIEMFDVDFGTIRFIMTDGDLEAQYAPDFGAPVVIESTLYDEEEHAWLQMRLEDGMLYYETSTDGSSWQLFAESKIPLPVDTVVPVLAGGNFMDVPNDLLVAAGSFEMCGNPG